MDLDLISSHRKMLRLGMSAGPRLGMKGSWLSGRPQARGPTSLEVLPGQRVEDPVV